MTFWKVLLIPHTLGPWRKLLLHLLHKEQKEQEKLPFLPRRKYQKGRKHLHQSGCGEKMLERLSQPQLPEIVFFVWLRNEWLHSWSSNAASSIGRRVPVCSGRLPRPTLLRCNLLARRRLHPTPPPPPELPIQTNGIISRSKWVGQMQRPKSLGRGGMRVGGGHSCNISRSSGGVGGRDTGNRRGLTCPAVKVEANKPLEVGVIATTTTVPTYLPPLLEWQRKQMYHGKWPWSHRPMRTCKG